jgi:hypothetical protein
MSERTRGAMDQLAEYVDGLPNICGSESPIDEGYAAGGRRPRSAVTGRASRSRASIALTRPRCICTSCARYWGEGVCTASGAELARRATEIVAHDL